MVDSSMVVGPARLGKQLEKASPDLLREMLGAVVATLMGAEANGLSNAEYAGGE